MKKLKEKLEELEGEGEEGPKEKKKPRKEDLGTTSDELAVVA